MVTRREVRGRPAARGSGTVEVRLRTGRDPRCRVRCIPPRSLRALLPARGALLHAQLVWPALEHTLKCSHLFNILDSSNSIGVTERTAFILRIRQLAIGIANAYV